MHGVIRPKGAPRGKLPLSFQKATLPPEKGSENRGLVFLGGIAVAATALLVLGDVGSRREERVVTPRAEPREAAQVVTMEADDDTELSSEALEQVAPGAPRVAAEPMSPNSQPEARAPEGEDVVTDEPEVQDPAVLEAPASNGTVQEQPPSEENMQPEQPPPAPAEVPASPLVAEPPGPVIVPPTITPPQVPAPNIQRPRPVPAPYIPRPATMQPQTPTVYAPSPPTPAAPAPAQTPRVVRP